MSRTVDERVVEMRFDNENFEKNVRQTMNTLDSLSDKIEASTSAEKVSGISRAFANIDVSPLTKGLDAVNVKFSAMQSVSDTIIRNITNSVISASKKMMRVLNTPMQLIESGGKRRAQNIENAKFQLKGLGVAWDAIEEDISYGVKDTAYGLDSAAKAASQLVASQVQLGADMKAALRGISGVAAMTNSEYDDIAHIFTTVAGNGRLMGDQLNQLAGRGLNAAATLAKALNTTEAEVRDMTSKGKIDFATFAKAMDDAFGQHAKDANQTFQGALSNVKAALARTGVDVASSGFETLRLIFVDLIPVINKFNEKIKPLTGTLSKGLSYLSDVVVIFEKRMNSALDGKKFEYFIGNISAKLSRAFAEITRAMIQFIDKGGVDNTVTGIINVFKVLKQVLRPIADAFQQVFPKQSVRNLVDLTERFKEFTYSLWLTSDTQNTIKDVFVVLFAAIKRFGDLLKVVYSAAKPVIIELGKLVLKLLDAFANSTFSTNIANTSKSFSLLGTVVEFVCDKVSKLLGLLNNISFSTISGKITEFADKVKSNPIIQSLVALFTSIKDYILDIGHNLKPLLDQIKAVSKTFFEALGSIFETFNLSDAINMINAGMFGSLILQFKEVVGTLKGLTGSASFILTQIKTSITTLTRSLKVMEAQLQAGVLFTLAKAIALLAVSIFLLASVEPEKITNALGALTIGLIELISAFRAMNNFSGSVLEMIMGSVSGFVLIGQINLLTTALLKLSAALLILSLIPLDRMITALAGLAISIQIMVKALKSLDKVGGAGGAFGFDVLAAGLIMLAIALKIMSTIDPQQMVTTLILLGGALLELVLALNAMEAALPGAAALAIAAGALLLLAPVLRILSGMDLKGVGVAVLALGGSLLALAIGLTAMIAAAPGARALKIASTGLLGLAGALRLMSSIDPKTIGGILLLLGGALLELALGLTLMFAALPGVVALNAAVGALALLVPILKALGNMEMNQIKIALIAIGGALATIGLAGLLLAPTIPFVLALAGAIGLLATSVFLAGAGAMMLATAFTVIASIGTAAFTVLINGLTELVDLIPRMVKRISEAVKAFARAVIDASPLIAQAIIEVVKNILKVLGEAIPMFIETIDMIIETVKAKQSMQKIVQLGVDFISALCKGIADSAFTVAEQFAVMIINMLKALEGKYPEFIQAGFDLMNSLINGMADGLDNNKEKLRQSIERLLKSLFDFMLEMTKIQVPSIGDYIIQGLINGMESKHPMLMSVIDKVTGGILKRFKEGLDEHSPSKATEEDGMFLNEGLINGLEKGKGKVLSTVTEFGANVLSKFKNAISGIQGESIEPKVAPVLDFSSLEKGNMKLQDLLNARTLDISNAVKIGNTAVQSVNEANIDNTEVVKAIEKLDNEIVTLSNKMTNLRVYMNSNALVGEIAPDMDRALGGRAVSAKRATGSRSVSYSAAHA